MRAAAVTIVHGLGDRLVDIAESKRLITELEGTDAASRVRCACRLICAHDRRPTGCSDRQLIPVPHCGHVPHEEMPPVFAKYVLAFLEKHAPGIVAPTPVASARPEDSDLKQ
jgi:hypothetical protein